MTDHSAEIQPPLGRAGERLLDRIYDVVEDPKTPPKWARDLVVAYADDGDFYLPCFDRGHSHPEPWWCRPLNLRRAGHWPYALLTALTGWVVWVESC